MNKIKNIKIIFIISVFILMGIAAIYYLFPKESGDKPDVDDPFGYNLTERDAIYESSLQEITEATLPDTSYSVNEFEVMLADNENFRIMYSKPNKNFTIAIYNEDFNKARVEAENYFLEIMGVSKNEACELDVVVATPEFANPEEAGQTYSLNICE